MSFYSYTPHPFCGPDQHVKPHADKRADNRAVDADHLQIILDLVLDKFHQSIVTEFCQAFTDEPWDELMVFFQLAFEEVLHEFVKAVLPRLR